jgi:hypothetical protein
MTPKLTEELFQALAERPEQPLHIEDPATHARYVLVRLDVYERLQHAAEYETSEPDPREFYASFAEAVKDDLDAPRMERYDNDDEARKRP